MNAVEPVLFPYIGIAVQAIAIAAGAGGVVYGVALLMQRLRAGQ